MKRDQAEFRTQCALARAIDLRKRPGFLWSALPFGENRSAATGARLKAMGVKKGFPDILCLWAGRAIGIELKRPGGKQTPEQKAVEQAWNGTGGIYRVFDTYEDTLAFLEGIGALFPDRSLIRNSEAA
jgi:hypothetical protein